MKHGIKLSMASALSIISQNISTMFKARQSNGKKITEAQKKIRDDIHMSDLQKRLQVVCDRTPARYVPEIYGKIRRGFREPKKPTNKQKYKMYEKVA